MTELSTKKNSRSMVGSGWSSKIFLIASFLWTSIYPAVGMVVNNFGFSYGNLFDISSPNFSYIILMIVIETVVSWIVFELLFFLYRYVLAYNIYSFIVPMERMKSESRMFFVYRNIIYGIFINLCFFLPYLFSWLPFIGLVISFAMMLIYALHINKAYAEPIIGHFVFKCFVYPVFVYEILTIIWQVVEVLLWKN